VQTRRQFVAAAGASLAAAACSVKVARNAGADPMAGAASPPDPDLRTVLFQGDSITDAGRDRKITAPNVGSALGVGYPLIIAAALLDTEPDHGWRFFNRGVSGNKVYQLDERWQADCLDLKPDVLSILIGVNDFWHTLDGKYKGTVEKYEADYKALIKRTKAALPMVKLVICEPFTLKTGHVNDKWFPAIDGYRAAAKRVAEDAGAAFVAFQTMFDAAVKIAPPARWAGDGVHPTPDGAALMAHWWLRTAGQ